MMTFGGADAVKVACELDNMLVFRILRSPLAPGTGSEKVTLTLELGVRLYLEDLMQV
jgi:hypothetical protein